MRRSLVIAALLALAALIGVGAAHGEIFQKGTLRIFFDGGFAPRSLPRDRLAPVTISIDGSIATTDGSHPPPVRRLEFSLNRDGRLSTRGLPVCSSGLLQSTTSESALARCRPALVGHGSFRADLDSNQSAIPVAGTILAFNSRLQGKPALLLHLYGTVPVRATFVLPLTIGHRAKGQFGTVLRAKVPTLAAGLGSITDVTLKIGRQFSFEGKRRSFISASCAAPAGFQGAVFPFARGSFYFAGHTRIDIPLTRDCRVR
jgi:hypothetical protein